MSNEGMSTPETQPRKFEQELEPRLLNLSQLKNSPMNEHLDADENPLFKEGDGFRKIDTLSYLPGVEHVAFVRVEIDGGRESIQQILDNLPISADQYIGYGTDIGNVGFTTATADNISEKITRYGMNGRAALFIPHDIEYDY